MKDTEFTVDNYTYEDVAVKYDPDYANWEMNPDMHIEYKNIHFNSKVIFHGVKLKYIVGAVVLWQVCIMAALLFLVIK